MLLQLVDTLATYAFQRTATSSQVPILGASADTVTAYSYGTAVEYRRAFARVPSTLFRGLDVQVPPTAFVMSADIAPHPPAGFSLTDVASPSVNLSFLNTPTASLLIGKNAA